MGKSYHRQLTVPIESGQVWHRAQEVLGALPQLSSLDSGPGQVSALISISVTSWGEQVTVSVSEASEGTVIDIHSKSRFPLQVIDWGRNKRNVERVAEGLQPPG